MVSPETMEIAPSFPWQVDFFGYREMILDVEQLSGYTTLCPVHMSFQTILGSNSLNDKFLDVTIGGFLDLILSMIANDRSACSEMTSFPNMVRYNTSKAC